MKPLFKCDYCNFIGTEDVMKEHEEKCRTKYEERSCVNCKNRNHDKQFMIVKCNLHPEIPEGQMYIKCTDFEPDIPEERLNRGNFDWLGGPFI